VPAGSRRADADLLAGEILHRLDVIGARGRHHQHEAGIAIIDHEGLQLLLLRCEIDAMVEIAGNDVGAAAEHGLERVRAALEVDQLDIEAGLLVLAELLGEHRRQVAQAGAAAHCDRDLALRCGKAGGERQREQRAREPGNRVLHCFLRSAGGTIKQPDRLEKRSPGSGHRSFDAIA
jgi:hypothetical protein